MSLWLVGINFYLLLFYNFLMCAGPAQIPLEHPVETKTTVSPQVNISALTGPLETQSPKVVPEAPFSEPGWWIFTVIILILLGLVGLLRLCHKG